MDFGDAPRKFMIRGSGNVSLLSQLTTHPIFPSMVVHLHDRDQDRDHQQQQENAGQETTSSAADSSPVEPPPEDFR